MSRWAAFGVWLLAGVLWALSVAAVLSIGFLVVPFALGVTIYGALRARQGWPGAFAGVGLLVGWLAWLNRYGPGDHCTSTATSTECIQMWSPWPFLGFAVALVAVAVAVGLRRPGLS